MRAFCDRVLAQDAEPRVPVVEMVDEKLAAGRLDGYQYDDMPRRPRHMAPGAQRSGPDGGRPFTAMTRLRTCAARHQEAIVTALAAGTLDAAARGRS